MQSALRKNDEKMSENDPYANKRREVDATATNRNTGDVNSKDISDEDITDTNDTMPASKRTNVGKLPGDMREDEDQETTDTNMYTSF